MSISKLLFGEIALKKKLVTKEQVEECLEIQKKLKEMGITKTLGAVMHDKKYLSMVEIKEILREMTGTKDWNAIEGYEILGKLGKGGMGSVYKARHQKLDKLVALKVLPPELASDQEYLDRFMREARAAAKLNHPNIVQALDVGESYGYHYFAMEYVEGRTVKDMIEQDGPIPEGRALDVIAQIAEALVHAWKNSMIHRDIKPSNIIVTDEGTAKLCDLGLAKSVTEDSTITQTGVIMGTPFYLSPEQARSEDLDCRSDIYSLGVTLFHMVTGQVPFTGNSAATILYKHIFLDPPKPKSLNPKLSSGVSQLIFRMLAKKREDRPQDPAALLDEIRALRAQLDRRDGRGSTTPPPTTRSSAAAAAGTDDVVTRTMGRLDNTLVESGREGAGETGAITAEVGEISGPSTAISDPNATVSAESETGVITGKTTKAALGGGRAGAAARPRAPLGRAPRVALAGSLFGIAGIAGFVWVSATSPVAEALDPGPRDVLAAAAAPGGDEAISERLAAADRLWRAGGFGSAAKEVLSAVATGPGRTTRDEIAIARAREILLGEATRRFKEHDEAYSRLAREGTAGEGSATAFDELIRSVQALDLPALAKLVWEEKAKLERERTEIEQRPAETSPPSRAEGGSR